MPRRKREAENAPDSSTENLTPEQIEAALKADRDTGHPQLISGGTYAIYQAPDGGFVLVVQDQTGEVQRRHIPGRLIRLLARGGLGKQLSAIFEGRTAANGSLLDDTLAAADELVSADANE